MNYVGLIVAVAEEFEALGNIMKDTDTKDINGLTFVIGKIEGRECVLTKCGVGKVNAARTTQILIDKFPIEYVINVGVAGALNYQLDIGDVVIGEELVQHDFDITAFGHSKGYIPGVGTKMYCDTKLIERFENAIKNLNEKSYKIRVGTIASGDIFCTEVAMKDKIYAKFGADCVEMEGAAVAQVCCLSSMPFIVIRSISDSPNGKNEITYEQYVKMASKRGANVIKEFFKEEDNSKLTEVDE